MYCKHCGKKITDDSSFCPYCGGKQYASETKTDKKSKSTEQKVVEIPTIKAHFSDTTKWWIIGCGIWIVLNLYWLFAGDKSSNASEHFQPFSNKIHSSYSYYDITEFIVYVIGLPFIIWGVIMLNKKLNSDSSSSNQVPNNTADIDNINNALGL